MDNIDEIDPKEYGKNIGEPIMDVNHLDLVPISVDSAFKKHCPACDNGILLMRRNEETFELEELDCCIVCGQAIRYLDIEELRKSLG